VMVFIEPRAWKGRSGFGAGTREALSHHGSGADLIVLFGHPRLLADLPSRTPVLLAWHRQRLMQEAVARWLRGRLG
jgi:diphthamide synthase subunit DPH2